MSDVKSVPKLLGRKALFVILSALLMVAAMLVGARVVEADSIWHQSYQRGSESEACVAQTGETPWEDSWGTNPGWSPSWEQWANNGRGGWVCSRSITWATATVVTGSPSVTFTCSNSGVRSPGGGACAVGDLGPGGGIIFYVDMSMAAGSQFWEVGSDMGTAPWGCRGTDIMGTSTAIGTGAINTSLIKTGCVTAGIAARVASEPAGGYSDWFLPSLGELNQLCKYARNQSTSPFDVSVFCDDSGALRTEFPDSDDNDMYWSSSETTNNNAQYQRFSSGSQFTKGSKSALRVVRPVRSF